jgi:hypothetical protein
MMIFFYGLQQKINNIYNGKTLIHSRIKKCPLNGFSGNHIKINGRFLSLNHNLLIWGTH